MIKNFGVVMAKYTCRKCGSEFISYRPFVVLPVCERCNREKEQLKVLKGKSKDEDAEYEKNKNAVFGLVSIIVICIGVWGYYKGCATISYWDKIYVNNNLKTYSRANFDLKEGGSEIVKFDEKDMLNVELPAYNKTTGEEKSITLQVPLYKMWTKEISKENLDGKKIITAYEQPVINDGFNYIKPSDVIIEDSKEYNQLIEKLKIKYAFNNGEFKNWTFEKNNVNKNKE